MLRKKKKVKKIQVISITFRLHFFPHINFCFFFVCLFFLSTLYHDVVISIPLKAILLPHNDFTST